jgi:hypothetical protein
MRRRGTGAFDHSQVEEPSPETILCPLIVKIWTKKSSFCKLIYFQFTLKKLNGFF